MQDQKRTSGLYYSYDKETGRIALEFESGTLFYRIVFGINGFNDLPNFVSVETSKDGQAWTPVNTSTTDWLPPLRVAAVHDGDGSGKYATGGNHGNVDKRARGDQTARNILFQIRAGGQSLESSCEGHAEIIDMLVINEVMGWNTTREKRRYIMRQTFNLSFRAGSCEVQAHVEPLEDVLLARDAALQCVASGFQEQLCFYGRKVTVKQPYENGISSGSRHEAPDVLGVGLISEEHGQMTMWLDRTWEAGRGNMMLDEHPHVRISGNKAYLAVALDVDANQKDIGTTVALRTGQAYRYRGGYAWHGPTANPDIDSSFCYHINGKAHYIYVTANGQLVSV